MQKLQHSMVKPTRQRILAQQKGRCAICEINVLAESKTTTLDHDHETGVVRGVLCNNCNGLEGKVKNAATRAKREGTYLEWLEKLVLYLQKHASNQTNLIHPTHKTPLEKKAALAKRAAARRNTVTKRKPVAKSTDT